MRKLGISEILDKASKEDASRRATVLRENETPVLKHLLRLAFTPNVTWLLPEGAPPYTVNDLPDQQGNLYAEWRRFYLFFPGGNDNLSKAKRETLFIQILESLDPQDAALICAVKDGTMPYANITRELIDEAFPGLING